MLLSGVRRIRGRAVRNPRRAAVAQLPLRPDSLEQSRLRGLPRQLQSRRHQLHRFSQLHGRRRTLRHLRRTDGAHLLPGHRAAGYARQFAQLPLGRTAAPAQGVCVRLAAGARRTARRRSFRQRLLPAFENARRTLPQHAATDARRTAHGPRPGYRNGHGLRIRRRAARIFLALRRGQLLLLAGRRQHGPQSVPSDLGRTAPGGARRPAGKLSRHRLRVALAQRTFVSGRGRRTGAGRSRLRGGVPPGIGPFRRGAERQRTFRGRVVARIHPPHARPSPAERLPRQADHRRLGRRGPTAGHPARTGPGAARRGCLQLSEPRSGTHPTARIPRRHRPPPQSLGRAVARRRQPDVAPAAARGQDARPRTAGPRTGASGRGGHSLAHGGDPL